MFATMYSTQAILPQLGDSFGVSPAEAGPTISALVVALAVGAWIWGPLSDRIGLRRSLTLASALLVVPALAVPLAPTFALLLVARVAEGLVMPGLLTVGVGYIADVYKPRIGVAGDGLLRLDAGGGWADRAAGSRLAHRSVRLAVGDGRAGGAPRRGRRGGAPFAESDPVRHHADAPVGGRLVLLRNRTLIGATAAGAALFFGFVGVFSFIDYRLEATPFSMSPSAASLIFVLWVFGAVGPAAGNLVRPDRLEESGCSAARWRRASRHSADAVGSDVPDRARPGAVCRRDVCRSDRVPVGRGLLDCTTIAALPPPSTSARTTSPGRSAAICRDWPGSRGGGTVWVPSRQVCSRSVWWC